MALSTHVTNRFGSNTPFLRNLTNQDDDDAATVNSTRLGYACDAAEASFLTYAQVTYDDTDQRHIDMGVFGAIAFLKMWSTSQKDKGDFDQYREMLKDYAKTTTRARIVPEAAAPVEQEVDRFVGVSPDFPETDDD